MSALKFTLHVLSYLLFICSFSNSNFFFLLCPEASDKKKKIIHATNNFMPCEMEKANIQNNKQA